MSTDISKLFHIKPLSYLPIFVATHSFNYTIGFYRSLGASGNVLTDKRPAIVILIRRLPLRWLTYLILNVKSLPSKVGDAEGGWSCWDSITCSSGAWWDFTSGSGVDFHGQGCGLRPFSWHVIWEVVDKLLECRAIKRRQPLAGYVGRPTIVCGLSIW